MLDRECSHGTIHKGRRTDDSSIPEMDLVSTDDSSLEDNSISSAEVDSPGALAGMWDPPTPNKSSSVVSATPPTPSTSFRREIISFGDSIEERTAVKIVSDQLDALPKSVMFLSNPTPTQIIGQLTMLTHHMQFVCEHVDDLDLEISLKQAEKCAQGYLARKGLAGSSSRDSQSKHRPASSSASASPSILQRILGTSTSTSAQKNTIMGDDVDMEQYDC